MKVVVLSSLISINVNYYCRSILHRQGLSAASQNSYPLTRCPFVFQNRFSFFKLQFCIVLNHLFCFYTDVYLANNLSLSVYFCSVTKPVFSITHCPFALQNYLSSELKHSFVQLRFQLHRLSMSMYQCLCLCLWPSFSAQTGTSPLCREGGVEMHWN